METLFPKGSTNIIPKIAKLKGTFRAMSEDFRKKSHENIRRIVSVIEKESNCKVFLEIRKGYPSLFNDVEITQKTIDFAAMYLGEENVVELDERMTAEDFAYFSQKFLHAFTGFGVSNKHDKNRYGLHNSKFNPDEKSLLIGCGLMSWITINYHEPTLEINSILNDLISSSLNSSSSNSSRASSKKNFLIL